MRAALRLVTLLAATGLPATGMVAQAQDAEADAPAAPETTPSQGAPKTPNSRTGTAHLVVFSADIPARGAKVIAPDGQSVLTNDTGAAQLELPPGDHTLSLLWPIDGEPRAVPGVIVATGQTTEVIATVELDGSLQLDIMAPKGSERSDEPDVEATTEQVRTGTLTGQVKSEQDEQPVVNASIYVAGQAADAATDATGRFSLTLPVGTHTLSVIHTRYSTQTVPDVIVAEDQVNDIEIALTPAAIELEDFVVSAPHIEGGVASVLDDRRKSAAVSDAIGAADIAKMPANDAAQAAQRVVGATIVGGRFVYVRGLGERYSNALLNGAPLPSPEPDRATVPLDLFPSQILESIDISKTFTPDVPGDFAGGSVRIVTKSVPEEPLFGVSVSLGANTRSTFKGYYGQRHVGDLDLLALDDGSRDLSANIPTDYKLVSGERKPDGERVVSDELLEAASDINTEMALRRREMWPRMSASVAAGDSWSLGDDARIGVLASLVYRRSPQIIDETALDQPRIDNGRLDRATAYAGGTASDSIRWGAFTNTSLELSEDHKLSLLLMHSQLGDTNTRVISGWNELLASDVVTARQEFVTRGLTNSQLQGDHTFDALQGAELDWLLSLAQAERAENDTRDFVFIFDVTDDAWRYYDGAESGRHFFADQSELAKVGGLNWLQPIVGDDEDAFQLSAKAGTLVSLKDREFASRRFALRPYQRGIEDPSVLFCGATFDPISCPAQVFSGDLVGEGIRVEEGTRPEDSYTARLNVTAGYLMTEFSFGPAWRFLGGARIEHTLQTITPFDQFTGAETDDPENRARLEQTDILPAATIVFSPVEEGAIRLAVSRTIARPQLRELAPFAFQDFFGGALQSGNPDLRLTRILNADLRFEYFPTPEEVVAISLFAKDFQDPIEPILKPSSDTNTLTYQNAKGANLLGVEFEVRKNLSFITDALEDFGFIGSLMLAASSISVEQTGDEFITNLERPLVQAAPYVINAALDYENDSGTQFRVLYNVSGKRVFAVGVEMVDDAYLHPRHMIDLTASQRLGEQFKLRINVRNLLDTPYLVTLGKDAISGTAENNFRDGTIINEYREGVTVSLGLSYDY